MRLTRLLLLIVLCCLTSSCTMLQWLEPHNLWKLNRQRPLGSEDAYFSIPADAHPESKGQKTSGPKVTRDVQEVTAF